MGNRGQLYPLLPIGDSDKGQGEGEELCRIDSSLESEVNLDHGIGPVEVPQIAQGDVDRVAIALRRAIAAKLQGIRTFICVGGSYRIELGASICESGKPEVLGGRSYSVKWLDRAALFTAISDTVAIAIFLKRIAEVVTVVIAGFNFAACAGVGIALIRDRVIVEVR
jgi:hypothetical protein